MIIAIDGPAGTGKGTIAGLISKRLNYTYIDTGAMYRCIALKMLDENIKLDELNKIEKLLEDINIEFVNNEDKQHVLLDKKDVTEEIRTPRVNDIVSQVSAIKEVRIKLVSMQRKLGNAKDVVMEGRDITTVVFPNAEVKIYLTASPEERAKRRYNELIQKGVETTYEETLEKINARDENDMKKEMGALKIAEDAIVVDSTELSIEEVYEKINNIIKEKSAQLSANELMTNNEIIEKEPASRIFFRILFSIYCHIVYRAKVYGKENLPKGGKYIICANHVGLLDAISLAVYTKAMFHPMAKDDLFKNKICNWIFTSIGCFPVKRGKGDVEAVNTAKQILSENKILLIFPEGTRNLLRRGGNMKKGAAKIALSENATIIPIGFQGSYKPFTKIGINIGKPITLTEYKTGDEIEPKDVTDLTNRIQEEIIRLRDEEHHNGGNK